VAVGNQGSLGFHTFGKTAGKLGRSGRFTDFQEAADTIPENVSSPVSLDPGSRRHYGIRVVQKAHNSDELLASHVDLNSTRQGGKDMIPVGKKLKSEIPL
jgi:hypothetical protein